MGLLSAARIVAYGWIDALYAGPSHRFTYLGLRLGAAAHRRWQMRGLVVLLAVASAALLVGWQTRLAAAGLLVSLGWIELIDATTYLNHYWFLTLVAALRSWRRSGGRMSLDARRAGGPSTVARGWVWLFRFQVGVVYAFAGLAKLQPDWLVRALPLELWLPARADVPVLGRLVGIEAVPHAFAIAGAAFDCLIVPLLLWRRTRRPGVVRAGRLPRVHLGAVPDRGVPVADDRRVHGVLRARLAPPPARPARSPRGGAAGRPACAAHRVLVALAVAWVVVQLALPAAPPRLPRRPPLDRPGLPLRVERAAGGEGGQRHVPRPRPEHRPHVGGRPDGSSTRAPSCG